MCRLRNIAMRDYQESVTTGQTHRHRRTDGQTDTGQSDPYVLLCFASDTKKCTSILKYRSEFTIAGTNFEILQCFNVFVQSQKHANFSCIHMSFFFHENMTSLLNYITVTLRALFAWRGSYIYGNNHFIIQSKSQFFNIGPQQSHFYDFKF